MTGAESAENETEGEEFWHHWWRYHTKVSAAFFTGGVLLILFRNYFDPLIRSDMASFLIIPGGFSIFFAIYSLLYPACMDRTPIWRLR